MSGTGGSSVLCQISSTRDPSDRISRSLTCGTQVPETDVLWTDVCRQNQIHLSPGAQGGFLGFVYDTEAYYSYH